MSWEEKGLCAQPENFEYMALDRDLFFNPEYEYEGKYVCQFCPVRAACLAKGLKKAPIGNSNPILPEGIWGGLTKRERKSLLRRQEISLAKLLGRAQKLLRDETPPIAS